ncbi:DUF1540 domain-containing protein [uncultured Clostridium sp.]|uniref:DUF1540 domain-containing protein n=1 Tax=uncultured Clostridium sp. TaxID=59620 RepID=UPI0026234321|nr:DUF1540 domain-containing protein [uncultured Clostridium sp.]
MTTLKCDVTDCNHNKQSCCCNNEITVGGVQAESSSETNCKNFECKSGALSNDVRDINPSLYVNCSADTCIHNKGQSCVANSIEISNNLSSYASDTQCASFVER